MSDLHVYTYNKRRNFTVVDNAMRDDLSLSDGSFRVLIWLLNRPPAWQINTASIAKLRGYSCGKVTAISKELQEMGYLMIEKLKNGHTIWHVSEVKGTFVDGNFAHPSLDLEVTASPVEKPYPKNRDEVKFQRFTDNNPEKTDSHEVIHRPDTKNPYTKNCDALVSKELSKTTTTNIYNAREENFSVDDYPERQPSQQPKSQRIAIDWQPKPDTVERLRQRQLPEQFISDYLMEFTAYWSSTNTQRVEWDSQFIRQAVQQYERRRGSLDAPKAPNPYAKVDVLSWEPSPELIERIMTERSTGLFPITTRYISTQLDSFRSYRAGKQYYSENSIAEDFRIFAIRGWDDYGIAAEMRKRTAETQLQTAQTRLNTAQAQQPFSANVMDHYDPDKTLANPYAGKGAKELAMAVKAERAAAAGESWKDGAIDGEVVDSEPVDTRAALFKMMGFQSPSRS